jgi:hypothetical protein
VIVQVVPIPTQTGASGDGIGMGAGASGVFIGASDGGVVGPSGCGPPGAAGPSGGAGAAGPSGGVGAGAEPSSPRGLLAESGSRLLAPSRGNVGSLSGSYWFGWWQASASATGSKTQGETRDKTWLAIVNPEQNEPTLASGDDAALAHARRFAVFNTPAFRAVPPFACLMKRRTLGGAAGEHP